MSKICGISPPRARGCAGEAGLLPHDHRHGLSTSPQPLLSLSLVLEVIQKNTSTISPTQLKALALAHVQQTGVRELGKPFVPPVSGTRWGNSLAGHVECLVAAPEDMGGHHTCDRDPAPLHAITATPAPATSYNSESRTDHIPPRDFDEDLDTPLDDVKYPPVEGRSVAPWDDATYRVVVYRLHDSFSSTTGEGMDYDEMDDREDHHDHEEFEDVRRRYATGRLDTHHATNPTTTTASPGVGAGVGGALALPARSLHGVWESLHLAPGVKERLLRYCTSAFLFSDAQVTLPLPLLPFPYYPPPLSPSSYYPNPDPDPNPNQVAPTLVSWNRVVLLHGPPGSGKTTLSRALAHKLTATLSDRFREGRLVEIQAHALFSKWFSESGKLVGRLFAQIRDLVQDPHLLVFVLIDEVESLTAARSAALQGRCVFLLSHSTFNNKKKIL